MNGFFITGTDTGVGKTVTAAAITQALDGCYWKPIQSGVADEEADQMRVQQLTGLSDVNFHQSIYTLRASLSPNQAATLENISIDLAACSLPQRPSPIIVEGAGGVFVPLNKHKCMLDLMQKLALPIVIVCRGTLGTINHTLLTIEALRQRQLQIQGIVFVGELHRANQDNIEEWSGVKTLFHIPYFEILTQKIFQQWIMRHKQNIQEVLV